MNMKPNSPITVQICYKPEFKAQALKLSRQLSHNALSLELSESMAPDTSREVKRLITANPKTDWLLLVSDEMSVQVIDLNLNLSYKAFPEVLICQLLNSNGYAIH